MLSKISNFKIEGKLLFLIIVVTFFALLASGASYYFLDANATLQARTDHLESVKVLKTDDILDWEASIDKEIQHVSNLGDWTDPLTEHKEDGNIDTSTFELASTNLNNVYQGGPFKILYITSPDGVILLSSDTRLLGEDVSDAANFQKGSIELYRHNFYMDDLLQKFAIARATPIKSETGELLGVAIGIADTQLVEESMEQRVGLGETGETYVVNSSSVLVSESRFGQNFKGSSISSEPIRHCLLENSGDGVYKDYRGVEVLSSYSWLEDMDACILAEIDKNEAFKDIYRSLALILGGGIFLMGLTVFFAQKLAKKISDPIEDLTKVAKRMREGDLDVHITMDREDEIGELAETMQVMADELQAEQVRLRNAIKYLPIGFVLLSNNFELILSNESMLEIFDLNKDWVYEDLEGKVKEVGLREACSESAKEKKVIVKTFKFAEDRYGRAWVSPVFESSGSKDISNFILLFEDTTEEKLLDRTRDEFFAIASHELRTPLTSIKGNTSLMREYFKEKIDDPGIEEMIEDIHTSSVRLIELVNDFLDVSSLEQGEIKFENTEFNLVDLAKDTAKENEFVAKKKNLNLKVETDLKEARAIGDQKRTHQVLDNLINNAIKYTKKGEITISIKKEKDSIKVSVVDTGAGIVPENQKMLFRKFIQTGKDPLKRDATEGTGLGLYISKLIIEGMGGEIFLEKSEPGKGSTFSFTLPTASQA